MRNYDCRLFLFYNSGFDCRWRPSIVRRSRLLKFRRRRKTARSIRPSTTIHYTTASSRDIFDLIKPKLSICISIPMGTAYFMKSFRGQDQKRCPAIESSRDKKCFGVSGGERQEKKYF